MTFWPRQLATLGLIGLAAAGALPATRLLAPETVPPSPRREAELAPELDGAVAWLNTDHPIRLRDLRGRVVILDFWTYGCINCMHVLPVLRKLEQRRDGQPLEIIGIHSAKFENEKAPDHVRAAVERYGISHPVAVDSQMAIWDRYGVQAWPTVVVIGADGRIAAALPGEVDLGTLDALVAKLISKARSEGILANGPALPRRTPAASSGVLSYPGKILAAPDGRLFISDSRHHRVVVTAADGRVLDVVGNGKQGRRDGGFGEAELDDPQGMALDGETLYVADARGYVVLALNLTARTVRTLAGTGALGERPLRGPSPATQTPLRSPWDLVLRGRQLFVALAGSHQIGVIDLSRGLEQATIARLAGSGREDLIDGAADEAAFAQPSGLWLSRDGRTLFVADSEASAVRAVDTTSGRARTLLGTGLFDWGDGEGPIAPRLIQHPLAVAGSPGGLWIADTYNGKVKRMTPDGSALATILVGLAEPGGLALEPDGSLLIADTGHARILRLLPGATTPLEITVGERAEAPATSGDATLPQLPARGPADRLPDIDAAAELDLQLVAPPGFELAQGSPLSVELTSGGVSRSQTTGDASGPEARIVLPLPGGDVALGLNIHATICDTPAHRACHPLRRSYEVDVRPSTPSRSAARLEIRLPAPNQLPRNTGLTTQ